MIEVGLLGEAEEEVKSPDRNVENDGNNEKFVEGKIHLYIEMIS